MYNYKKNYLENQLIFEYSSKNNIGIDIQSPVLLKNIDINLLNKQLKNIIKDNFIFPEVSEFQALRHFTNISRNNFCIDTNIYPLGSCTMKYNPRINEWVAGLDYFNTLHPYMNIKNMQLALFIIWHLQQYLASLSGFHSVSLQPATGAHSEFTGLAIMKKAAHYKNQKKNIILIPDTAHGTNPASAKMLRLKVKHVKSNKHGYLDKASIAKHMSKDVLGIMITNPNTLGIFEKEIKEISKIVHSYGGYVYGDGANLNSLMGLVRPGDIGFDMLHFNLHKTFSTPHGGGGPGCGAIGVSKSLTPFLPSPIIKKNNNLSFYISKNQHTIGYIKSFFPNFSIVLRAWTYIRSMGKENLKKATTFAVLNANYIKVKLRDYYYFPYKEDCLHEIVISDKKQKIYNNISALDIAKRLMDYKIHPPTIYFPLNVSGAIMIEPTETESKKDLDYLCNALIFIAKDCKNNPSLIKNASFNTIVTRPDEIKAIKKPILKWNNLL